MYAHGMCLYRFVFTNADCRATATKWEVFVNLGTQRMQLLTMGQPPHIACSD